MKQHSLFLFLVLFLFFEFDMVHGQSNSPKKQIHPFRKITIHGMYSYHSRQSLSGYTFELGNEIKLQDRLYFHQSFAFTVHSGKDPQNSMSTQNSLSGSTIDPLLFITGGLQYTPSMQVEIIPKLLKISGGGLIRYQTTSWPDRYAFFSEETTPSVIPAHYKIYEIHPHTISIGLRFSANLQVIQQKSYSIRLNGFMQQDTNKDLIHGIGVLVAMNYMKNSK